jgi:hypothetical protein
MRAIGCMYYDYHRHPSGRAPTVWAIWHIEHGWQKQLRQMSPARLPSIPYLHASQSPIPPPTRPPPCLPPAPPSLTPALLLRAGSAPVPLAWMRTFRAQICGCELRGRAG